jgi:hypothetical protein
MKRAGLNKITNRKRLWDIKGFNYGESPNYLWKNHQLNCGCKYCKMEQDRKKRENKAERLRTKRELRKAA